MSGEPAGVLPLLDLAGGPYAVGQALGRFGAAAVQKRLRHTRAWAGVMTHLGSAAATDLAARTEACLPKHWQELRGLADGLCLPFDEVFLWNCRGDLPSGAPDGCTTVQVPGTAERWIAHNEDGEPLLAGACGLARIAQDEGTGFTSFVYPGSLPGHSFAVTDRGLVQTVNNIRARESGAGLPRMVLARATLDAATLDEAVALIRRLPRSGAFHLTLAQAGDPRLLSVEFATGRCSAQEVRAVSSHANHLVHAAMADLPQVVTASSADRQARGDALCAGADAADGAFALRLLADRAPSQLPIHRTDPGDPDGENTLATAVFHVLTDRVDWAVHGDPRRPPDVAFGASLWPDDARETFRPA